MFQLQQVVGPMLRFAEDLIPMMNVLTSEDDSESKESGKSKLNLEDDVSLKKSCRINFGHVKRL